MNIITFDQFKDSFEKEINNKKNKEGFIDKEIRDIEKFLFYNKPSGHPSNIDWSQLKKTGRVFDITLRKVHIPLLAEAFQGFDIDSEYSNERNNDTLSLNIIEQARQLCYYYQWLKQFKSRFKPSSKKSNLTHKQKMLALHYLGLNLKIGDNKKLASILSEILELSEDNTRQYLSYLSSGKNDVRTKNNLTKINQLFKKQGLTDISNIIELDLEQFDPRL